MSRRSQSFFDSLLLLPWWVSAGLGVLLFILLSALRNNLATVGGPLGKGLAQGMGMFPVAALVIFGAIALMSVYLYSETRVGGD